MPLNLYLLFTSLSVKTTAISNRPIRHWQKIPYIFCL